MATQPHMFPEIEGPDFVQSTEITGVAGDVLEVHGGIGGVGRINPIAEAVRDGELNILYLLNTKPFNPETEDTDEPEIAGRCVKAPGLWRDVTGYHFAIWARAYFWDQFDVDHQRALVLHELLHIEVERDKNGEARFSTRKHDVEDFVDIARQYGPAALAGDGARYVRAAALFAGEPEPIGRRAVSDIAHDVVDALAESAGVPDGAREHLHREVDAAASIKPLQDLATSTGTDITITAGGRSATIKGRKDQALADATAHKLSRGKVTADDRVGAIECRGANHVPGHTKGCPKWDPNADPDGARPF